MSDFRDVHDGRAVTPCSCLPLDRLAQSAHPPEADGCDRTGWSAMGPLGDIQIKEAANWAASKSNHFHHDRLLACPGPPRLTHSLILLSITSTSALDGILQWLVGLGGIAIRQSGSFISAQTAARHT